MAFYSGMSVSENVSTRRIFGIYGAAARPNNMHVYKRKKIGKIENLVVNLLLDTVT